MKSLRIVLVTVLLAIVVAPAGADELIARSFELKHKDAGKVVEMLQSLMSRDGSYSIHPSRNSIVITDNRETLGRIAELIDQLDRSPRQYTLRLTLVSASRSANPPPVSEDLREISRKMAGVLRFNTFTRLGAVAARGREGDTLSMAVDGHQASFSFGDFDPLSQSLRIEEFRLDRPESGSDGGPLLRTSLNLRVGQTVVLGASRQAESGKALMIVLLAEETR
jgi:hypothetical protein